MFCMHNVAIIYQPNTIIQIQATNQGEEKDCINTTFKLTQAAGLPAAGRNALQRPFMPLALIHSQWTFLCSKGMVLVKAMEWLGAERPTAL